MATDGPTCLAIVCGDGTNGVWTAEEHHELGFELTGLLAGESQLTIKLMHDGHADYTSLHISVTVAASTKLSCTEKHFCLRSCCASTIYASK